MTHLILYSKPGCHLCEGLHEKLEQIEQPRFDLEVRDITTREDWFQKYQYEIPVLCYVANGEDSASSGLEKPIPRMSPRASAEQVARMLQKYLPENLLENEAQ
jgi:hypothetical protein